MVVKAQPRESSQALWAQGRDYLGGTDGDAAAAKIKELAAASFTCNLGWLTGVAADRSTAAANTRRYATLAGQLAGLPTGTWLEADAPHLGVDVSPTLCADNLRAIARRLPPGRMIQLGAEDASRTEAVLGTVLAAHRAGLPVRATLQANLHRSSGDADRLIAERVPVRLVKGGFPETADIALQRPEAIDESYLRLARRFAEARVPLTLATHDAEILSRVSVAPGTPVEMLLGVLPEQARSLRAAGRPVRLYVPFGTAWEEYVAKRISDAAKTRPGVRT
jgi:proline dehydrogenase